MTEHLPAAGAGIDAAAMAEVIRKYQSGVWRYLRSLGCSYAEADDLVQETFLAVLQRPFRDCGPAATAAYLRKVARHRLISARRHSRRMVVTEQIDQIDQTWDRWATDDDENGQALLRALRTCLDSLTDRARQALAMRYRDGRSRREIADALSLTDHGARNLLQRAKQKLRICIDKKLP